jgi:hypothetical protein
VLGVLLDAPLEGGVPVGALEVLGELDGAEEVLGADDVLGLDDVLGAEVVGALSDLAAGFLSSPQAARAMAAAAARTSGVFMVLFLRSDRYGQWCTAVVAIAAPVSSERGADYSRAAEEASSPFTFAS